MFPMGCPVFGSFFFAGPVRPLREDLFSEFIGYPKRSNHSVFFVKITPIFRFYSRDGRVIHSGKPAEIFRIAHGLAYYRFSAALATPKQVPTLFFKDARPILSMKQVAGTLDGSTARNAIDRR